MRIILLTSLTRGLKNSLAFFIFFFYLKPSSNTQKDSVICNGNTLCICLSESEFRGLPVWCPYTAHPMDPQCGPLGTCWKSNCFLRVLFLDSQSNSNKKLQGFLGSAGRENKSIQILPSPRCSFFH